MGNRSIYLRMMAEKILKIAQEMIEEANRLDGISTQGREGS